MKEQSFKALAAASAVTLATAASAGTYDPSLDYVISINDGDSFAVGGTPITFSVTLPAGGTVTGFSFEGTLFIDPIGFPGVPRQTELTITAPNATSYSVGGDPPSGTPWDFHNASATNNVTYRHGIGGEAWGGDGLPDFGLDSGLEGVWEFTFARVSGFPSTSVWSDVTITLHMVPAPGALALFGLALAAGRRRRRSA